MLDGFALADTTPQRERYIDILLTALDDDDGRVRKAAVRALGTVGTLLHADPLPPEARETLFANLEALALEQPDERATHTRRAISNIDPDPFAGLFE